MTDTSILNANIATLPDFGATISEVDAPIIRPENVSAVRALEAALAVVQATIKAIQETPIKTPLNLAEFAAAENREKEIIDSLKKLGVINLPTPIGGLPVATPIGIGTVPKPITREEYTAKVRAELLKFEARDAKKGAALKINLNKQILANKVPNVIGYHPVNMGFLNLIKGSKINIDLSTASFDNIIVIMLRRGSSEYISITGDTTFALLYDYDAIGIRSKGFLTLGTPDVETVPPPTPTETPVKLGFEETEPIPDDD